MPSCAFSSSQCTSSRGADSAYPEPIKPFGATPSRTKNARDPGSIERARPHAHSMSTCPRVSMRFRSRASSGQFHSFGFHA
jgi:hypothetical protein